MNLQRTTALLFASLVFTGCASNAPPPPANATTERHHGHGEHRGQGERAGAGRGEHGEHRGGGHGGHGDGGHGKRGRGDETDRALDEVAQVHGAPGPWAVAGYRMGQYAMGKLGLPRGSFGVEVVHKSPKQVQYSCIADGAAAYSGASVGKLNLAWVEAPEADVVTVYRDKKSGKTVSVRPSASFRARYAQVAPDKTRELGREVMTLPDAEVFEEVPTP